MKQKGLCPPPRPPLELGSRSKSSEGGVPGRVLFQGAQRMNCRCFAEPKSPCWHRLGLSAEALAEADQATPTRGERWL